jgi:hypothetical protein
MDVAIGYHRSGRAARRAAAEIGALGGRVTTIRANLADPGEARRLVRGRSADSTFSSTAPRSSSARRSPLLRHLSPYITGQVLKVNGGEGVTS